MKYVDEFRDPAKIERALAEIRNLAASERRFRIMEICGGHTHAIFRFGLHDLLPRNVELIHGPGCPVCVLPRARVDEGLRLTADPDVIFTAFGDMLRVPGANGSPLDSKTRGADVRFVYSPLDALTLAEQNPNRRVVFFAIGFETTAPATALTLLQARQRNVRNFFVYCNHVLVLPAIRALLNAPEMYLDGFIGPGHVSTIIGCHAYEFIARDYGRPVAISGFEPLDLLQAIIVVLRQLRQGIAQIENRYARVVPWDGNPAAQRLLAEVFAVREQFEWRGLGQIPDSGYRLRPEFAAWDAEQAFALTQTSVPDPTETQCGAVLTGALKPAQCPLFGNICTPAHPLGALMVSSEGACAAHYKYVGPSTSAPLAPVS